MPHKMKAYTSYDEWKQDQSRENQQLINALQNLIEQTAPHLQTMVKWGQGCFTDEKSPKIFIHTEPNFVQLGFYHGSALVDRYELLEGKGKYVRHIKIKTVEDIDKEKLTELIKQIVD